MGAAAVERPRGMGGGMVRAADLRCVTGDPIAASHRG